MCHGEMVLEVNAEVPYGGTGGCRSYGVDAELNSVVWHGRISGVDEHRLTSCVARRDTLVDADVYVWSYANHVLATGLLVPCLPGLAGVVLL